MPFDSAELREGIIEMFDEVSDRGHEWFDHDRHQVVSICRAKPLELPTWEPVPPRIVQPFVLSEREMFGESPERIIERESKWIDPQEPAGACFFVVVDMTEFMLSCNELRQAEISACRLCERVLDGEVTTSDGYVRSLVEIYANVPPGDASGIAAAMVAARILRGDE